MIKSTHRRSLAVICTVFACSIALTSSASDLVGVRKDHFHQLGAAYKTVFDTVLHGGDVQSETFRQSLRVIEDAGHNIYTWFPAGSGPQPGVKTAAKPEIWTSADDFRATQDAFAHQVATLQQTAAGGDAAAIRSEVLKLGGKCKACHDKFRVPNEDN